MRRPRLALVPGEPAGVGPELCVRAAQQTRDADLVVFSDRGCLQRAAAALSLPLAFAAADAASTPGILPLVEIPNPVATAFGTPDAANAGSVIESLQTAAAACLAGDFDGLVTGPVHKAAINAGGIAYTGTTGLLADQAGCDVVMMLANDIVRVALATTHLPLRAVPDAIRVEGLQRTLRILHASLRDDFGIDAPRIAVLGLNPHAGEDGHLGREELDTILPAIHALRAEGMTLIGPLPADTAFLPGKLTGFDAVLAMYHDQGLPVLKYSGFERAVNLTLGLPYPRVAVDHGTALDLAGSGRADPSSLFAAIDTCTRLATGRLQRAIAGTGMKRRNTSGPRKPTHDAAGFRTDAKKRLGQNFLHDHDVIERIVLAIDPQPGDRIVEIGPGQGALTLPLLDRHGALTAIEFDRDLLQPLAAAAQDHGALTLLNADVLSVDFTALADGRPLRLAGNLPYNLSSPILFHALDHAEAITDMHFMLQKEVVERMAAAPGSKVYGRLSVMLQACCAVTPLFTVPPGAFRPAPKVDSAVVRLRPHPGADIGIDDRACFAQVVRAAFGQRRKTLRNALSGVADSATIDAAGLRPDMRAEQISVDDFIHLANTLGAA